MALAGNVLAQNQSATTSSSTTKNSEPYFLKNLQITGFFLNTSGTWINSHNAAKGFGFTPAGNVDRFGQRSTNSLAVERNMVQIDVNDDFTENDSMFMRDWFVYEPSYPWEVACLGPGATWLGALRGQSFTAMHCNSDFYNTYGIRELWFKHRQGPLDLFIGRQIVTWGESLAFRVGDQINPQNLSWNFGFANLEQSRMPLWMVHPILNLPSLGPLSSNYLELVYVPGFDFLYNHVDYSDDHLNGLDNIAGRVNIAAANPGGRFAGQLDCRVLFTPLGGKVIPAAGFPGFCGTAAPVALFQTGTGIPGQGPGEYFGLPDPRLPNATWGNSQVGVRFHTLFENAELTAFYLWSHEYNPVLKIAQTPALEVAPSFFERRLIEYYPQYQSLGFTANRPLYLPGPLAQLPFVLRGEAFYTNHQTFNTDFIPGTVYTDFNPAVGTPDALYYSDTLKWMVALDLDQAYVPWLTSTGNLTVNYEFTDLTTLSPSKFVQEAASYFTPLYHNDVNMLLNVGTSWWWGAVSPTWTMIYAPQGETWLFFPTLQLVPPWTNKYFVKLQWIQILGTDRYNLDGGLFKGKNMLIGQFEYNFDLL